MYNIQIVHEQPNSILATGIAAVLKKTLRHDATTVSFNQLISVSKQPEAILVFPIQSNAEVEKIATKLRGSNHRCQMVFIYLNELENESVKVLAGFAHVAILSAYCTPDEMGGYIGQIGGNAAVLCERTKDILLKNIMQPGAKHTHFEFSATEQAIIKASRQGASIIETAAELKLSTNTVAAYRSKMLKKYGFKSMGQLLAAQMNTGIGL